MPTEEPTGRNPLLTTHGATLKYGDPGLATPIVEAVIHFYESKITSGELIPAKPRPKLAKALHGIKRASHPTVSIVDSWTPVTDEEWDRLLKEGAQIVTP